MATQLLHSPIFIDGVRVSDIELSIIIGEMLTNLFTPAAIVLYPFGIDNARLFVGGLASPKSFSIVLGINNANLYFMRPAIIPCLSLTFGMA